MNLFSDCLTCEGLYSKDSAENVQKLLQQVYLFFPEQPIKNSNFANKAL